MPSPVSALIHAATMVTAGVFLLVRCSVLFELAPSVLQYVAIIGAATAIMAATSGLFQNDLKKVIAYSTCSQLGFMVFACGVSQYSLSLFHLVNHAFFKALLFLGAGAVIHAVSNEQDTRKFGALSRLLPYTYVMFLIGSLALMGFPFLTGFYSKDVILEVTASGQTVTSLYAYNLGAITAFFTSFYSLRLLKLTFYGVSRSPRAYLLHTHELVEDMAYPLAVLALGSLFFGYFARDLFIGFGNSYWTGVITDATSAITAHREGEFLPLATKLVPLYGMLLALLVLLADDRIASPHYLLRTKTSLIKFYRFLSSKWGFDAVYNEFLALKTLTFAYNNFALTDKGLLEAIGPTGLGQVTHRIGLLLAKAQTGRVYDYAYFMLLGLYAGLILMDFVIDPTGVGYLVESTEVLTSTDSQTSLLTPPPCPISAYQLKLYGYKHTLKNTTLTTALHQRTATLFSWCFLSINRFKLKSQLICIICSSRALLPAVGGLGLHSYTAGTTPFAEMKRNYKNKIERIMTYAEQNYWTFLQNTHAPCLISTIREIWLRLVTMSGSRWKGCYAGVKSSPFYRVGPVPVVVQENLDIASHAQYSNVIGILVFSFIVGGVLGWIRSRIYAPNAHVVDLPGIELSERAFEALAAVLDEVEANPLGASHLYFKAIMAGGSTGTLALTVLCGLAVLHPETFELLQSGLKGLVRPRIAEFVQAMNNAAAEPAAHAASPNPGYIVAFILVLLLSFVVIWWACPVPAALPTATPANTPNTNPVATPVNTPNTNPVASTSLTVWLPNRRKAEVRNSCGLDFSSSGTTTTTLLPILVFLSICEAGTGVDITESMAIYLYFSTLLTFNTTLQTLDNLRPIQTTLANQKSTFAPTKQNTIMLSWTTIWCSLTKAISRWLFSTNNTVTGAIQSRRVLPLPRLTFTINVPPVAVPDGANEGFRLATETQSMPMNPVIFVVVGLFAVGAAIWWGVAPAPVPVTPEMLRHSGEHLANLLEMIRANPAGVSVELLRAIMRQDETAAQVLTGLHYLSVNQPEDFALLRADLRSIVLIGVRKYMEAVARAEAGIHVSPANPGYFIAGFLLIAAVCVFMLWWTWPASTSAVAWVPVGVNTPTIESTSSQEPGFTTDASVVKVDADSTSTATATAPTTEGLAVGGNCSTR